MLKRIALRVGAGVGAALMTALATGIATITAAFAVYAALRLYISAAGAAAVTALAFTAIATGVAYVAPQLIKAPVAPSLPEKERKLDPVLVALISEAAFSAVPFAANLVLAQLIRRKSRHNDQKHSRR